jgi:lipopolysaccharide transport system ATP-binding protein
VEPAISFQDVYKEYPFYQHIVTAGFKSFLFHLPKNIASLKKARFTALHGISFNIKKGETFGIIGKNGSGKSTILGIMAGVIREDRGRVKTSGKISSLLELGAGFHPDLSGVENIILNGILTGSTREEVVDKIDSIVEFSELGDFIYQPMRTYSSGMHLRLGFSVAVHVDPEILLIDEALAVGDLNFQDKCQKKMKEFRESGATIVIVSHDMAAISKLCDEALWIDGGKVMAIGPARDVIMQYLSSMGQHSFQIDTGETPNEDEAPEVTGEKEEILGAAADEYATEAEEADGWSASSPEKDEDFQVPASPWWDLPSVVEECDHLITGNSDITFYDLLKVEYMPDCLEQGLSICCRLKGIEKNFMINNICKSFDVVDDEAEIRRIISGSGGFKGNSYDLFLCVDLLHRIKELNRFTGKIHGLLRENGVMIAMEYLGPAGYKRPQKTLEVARMLLSMIGCEPGELDDRQDRTGGLSAAKVIPAIEKKFDIIAVRYFAGPLFDLVLNDIIGMGPTPTNKKKNAVIGTVIGLDRFLRKEGVLSNEYAVIIARRKAAF